MFKRPSVHYGRTPEPVTPYQRAAQVWDERIGSARVTYLPFGIGPRTCIGASFALQEATIVLATLVHRFDMQLIPGAKVWPLQKITLRPSNGLPMRVSPRQRGSAPVCQLDRQTT